MAGFHGDPRCKQDVEVVPRPHRAVGEVRSAGHGRRLLSRRRSAARARAGSPGFVGVPHWCPLFLGPRAAFYATGVATLCVRRCGWRSRPPPPLGRREPDHAVAADFDVPRLPCVPLHFSAPRPVPDCRLLVLGAGPSRCPACCVAGAARAVDQWQSGRRRRVGRERRVLPSHRQFGPDCGHGLHGPPACGAPTPGARSSRPVLPATG